MCFYAKVRMKTNAGFTRLNRVQIIGLCMNLNDNLIHLYFLVEITLPKDSNVHAAEYQLYLPSKEELKSKLMEWSEQK